MKYLSLLSSLTLLLLFTACANSQENDQASAETPTTVSETPTPDFVNIQVDEFEALRRDLPEAVVLDVRTPEEVAQGSIEGALNLDVKDPAFTSKIADLDPDATYLVYCRSGSRSVTASKLMQEAGFTDLFNLEGGYMAWKAQTQQE